MPVLHRSEKSYIVGTNGNDRLVGTNGNDTILGLAGQDRLVGKGGNDTLNGGTGGDTLIGGSGNNFLSGDGGRDRFILQKGAGRDRILDFQDGRDRLGLSSNLRFSDLDILRQGKNTVIKADGDVLALLVGVNVNRIGANDFG